MLFLVTSYHSWQKFLTMSLKVLTSIPLLPLSSVPKIQITNKIQIQINTNSSGRLNNNRYMVEERVDRQALPFIENKLPKQNRYTRGRGGGGKESLLISSTCSEFSQRSHRVLQCRLGQTYLRLPSSPKLNVNKWKYK